MKNRIKKMKEVWPNFDYEMDLIERSANFEVAKTGNLGAIRLCMAYAFEAGVVAANSARSSTEETRRLEARERS